MLNWALVKHPYAESLLGTSVLKEFLKHEPTDEDYSKCSKLPINNDRYSYWLLHDKKALGVITIKSSETANFYIPVAVFTPIETLN